MLELIATCYKKYFVSKTDETRIQFFRYLFVGGASTVVDMGIFYVAVNIFSIHYLLAQTLGFIFGISVNYLLSIAWIFKSTGNFKRELFLFAAIGIGGLLLSYLILWFLISRLDIHAFQDMLAKSVAVLLVLIWNFGMRKKFAFNS